MIDLINRRFVPVCFDLLNEGAIGDPDARQFIIDARPELGNENGVSPPPVFLMTPGGDILGEIDNWASPDEFLDEMIRVLEMNPRYNRRSSDEMNLRPLDEARLLMDLADDEGAREILCKEEGGQARYLLGYLARLQGNWEEMESHLCKVDCADLADDVAMERSHRDWKSRNYEGILQHLHGIPTGSNRYTEARYYAGLAHYHLDRREESLRAWKEVITTSPQDPWIYRADWAYTNVAEGLRSSFSPWDKRVSLLGRIGYMGNRNPDLTGAPLEVQLPLPGLPKRRLLGLTMGEGLSVKAVIPGTAAEKAGAKPGDVIRSFDGIVVRDKTHLFKLIQEMSPETSFPIVVLRNGREETIQATFEVAGQ